MNKNTSVQLGPGFFGCLGLLFITLKLCNVINWSWWWAPLSSVLVILLIVGIILVIVEVLK